MLTALTFALALIQPPTYRALTLTNDAGMGTATIDATTSGLTITSDAEERRLVWLPLAEGKANTVISAPASRDASPPPGTRVVSCAQGRFGCAEWTLEPRAALSISIAFLRAVALEPIMFILADESRHVMSQTGVLVGDTKPWLQLGPDGFVNAPTSAKPIALWNSKEDKQTRSGAQIRIDNETDAPYRLFFQLDVPMDPATGRRSVEGAAGGAAVALVNCPMTPAICGQMDLPPRTTTLIPARLLDTFAPSSTVQLVARRPTGDVPPSDTAVVTLEPPTDATASSRANVPSRQFNGRTGAVVPLDNTGIADWDYLNPRKAPLIRQTPGIPPTPWTIFAFENRTTDRTFVVAVPVNASAGSRAGRATAAASGVTIEPCKHVDGQCAILTVSPGTTQAIPLEDLIEADRPVVKFQVSFFEEDVTPAQAIGYARTGTAPFESPSRTVWGLVAKISGSTDPEVPKDASGAAQRITADTPFDSRTTSSLQGLARLNAKPMLGDRADADIDLLFEQSALGGKDARLPAAGAKNDLNVMSVPKYKFTIYGQNGVQFAFGKFAFLDTVLLSDAGEGFRFNWRNFGVGRIVKRESAANEPDNGNADHDVWIAQANNVLTRDAGALRSINLTAVYGHDRAASTTNAAGTRTDPPDKRYWTSGVEAFFAIPQIHTQGSGGVFRSRRRVSEPTPALADGDGTMGYFTATVSWLGPNTGARVRTVQRSLGLTLAGGSEDDPSTEANEGYLGEQAKFTPDSIFLTTLDPLLGPKPAFTPNTLSGKSYLSFVFTDQTFSALELVADILKIPSTDIVSRRTIVRYSTYRYAAPVLGFRAPGDEIALEFTIETPRGVRASLAFSQFLNAAGYDPLFRRDPRRVTAFIQLQM